MTISMEEEEGKNIQEQGQLNTERPFMEDEKMGDLKNLDEKGVANL